MKEFQIIAETYTDIYGVKWRRKWIGVVEARTLRSAVNKVKRKYRGCPKGRLSVGWTNPKTGRYESEVI